MKEITLNTPLQCFFSEMEKLFPKESNSIEMGRHFLACELKINTGLYPYHIYRSADWTTMFWTCRGDAFEGSFLHFQTALNYIERLATRNCPQNNYPFRSYLVPSEYTYLGMPTCDPEVLSLHRIEVDFNMGVASVKFHRAKASTEGSVPFESWHEDFAPGNLVGTLGNEPNIGLVAEANLGSIKILLGDGTIKKFEEKDLKILKKDAVQG